MRKTWSIALLFVFFLPPVLAQKKSEDMITISGYGVGIEKSCAAFVRETDEKDAGKAMMYGGKKLHFERQLYVEWFSGFLTAHSWMKEGQNISGGRNVHDLLSWIRTYCEKHPLDSFLIATDALFLELQKKK